MRPPPSWNWNTTLCQVGRRREQNAHCVDNKCTTLLLFHYATYSCWWWWCFLLHLRLHLEWKVSRCHDFAWQAGPSGWRELISLSAVPSVIYLMMRKESQTRPSQATLPLPGHAMAISVQYVSAFLPSLENKLSTLDVKTKPLLLLLLLLYETQKEKKTKSRCCCQHVRCCAALYGVVVACWLFISSCWVLTPFTSTSLRLPFFLLLPDPI